MISRENGKKLIKTYCDNNGVDYEKAVSQYNASTLECVILCVSNPKAPEADGLANDIETQMLPTLYLYQDGTFKETEYTEEFLK